MLTSHILQRPLLQCVAALTVMTMPLMARAQSSNNDIMLLPVPKAVTRGVGELSLDAGFSVRIEGYAEPRLVQAKERFLIVLSRETGITVWKPSDSSTWLKIVAAGPSKPLQQVGEDESYHLEVSSTGAEIRAANTLGILHGLQTLLQLVTITPHGFVIPALTIDDSPRFPWRGLLIDTSRHFIPVEGLKRNLDAMEAVKMNVFHWHLSDDQGFRAESHVYPLLQGKGSDGQFYTQEQMKEIVAYARDRGIRVVPEFDMPGHTTSWLVGYPELGSGGGPYTIERKWGVFNPAMDPTRESTYRFIDRLVAEMAAIFPDAYFHVGGDECNGKAWDANPRIQEFMKQHGLKNDEALQSYFSNRVQHIVEQHGKIPTGWDEILQPSTAKSVLIQSWRGAQSLVTAAQQGNDVILSKGYYLNLNLAASDYYKTDPLGGPAAGLSMEQQKHVLGGEAAMWTEPASQENIDSRIWPRNGAVAERLWSPSATTQDVDALYARLAFLARHLNAYSLHHETVYPAMLTRMTGGENISSLKILGDVVEPLKNHDRGKLESLDAFTPLNRLTDAVPPESMLARDFSHLCDRIVNGTATNVDVERIRQLLTLWRGNDATLQPQLAKSALTTELVPLSVSLREVAEVGLEALAHIEDHTPVSGEWRDTSLQKLQIAAKPQAAVLLMVVAPIKMLVTAATRMPTH